MVQASDLEYAGFWRRTGASIVDTILSCLLFLPLVGLVYGDSYWDDTRLVKGPGDFLLSWVLPAAIVICFWMFKGATPGKMLVSAQIVDARTGDKPSVLQLIGRYLAYFISALPLCLGFLWVAFDGRKQGWHDKLSNTVVVRRKSGSVQPVSFENGRAGV